MAPIHEHPEMSRHELPRVLEPIREARIERTRRAASYVAIASTLVATLFGWFLLLKWPGTISFTDVRTAELEKRVERIEFALQKINTSLGTLSEEVNGVQSLPEKGKSALQTLALRKEIDSVRDDVAKLNDAIAQNPEKAVALPLLRKDVDNLREAYQHDLETTRQTVDRIYDQNKWFIGLMFTIAISVFGLALSNLAQTKKTEAPADKSTSA